MKFVIAREDFVALMGKVQGVVPSKPVIPIISHVLIEADKRGITINATDLTVSIKATKTTTVEEEGAVALPAKHLFSLVRELIAPEVSFEMGKDKIVRITSGGSHFRLHAVDKHEFPSFPDIGQGKSIPIDGSFLKEMLYNTAFAVAREDNRQALKGVYMELQDGKITVVGTDGKRLAKVERPIEGEKEDDLSCIIPLKAVDEMMRILDNEEKATLTLLPDKVSLETRDTSLVAKLLMEQYPDYRQVLPKKESMKNVSLHREELLTLLRQVSLFTSEVTPSVKLTLQQGELGLQAMNTKVGEGNVQMPVDYHESKLEIAFHPHFFIDILRHSKDETVNFGVIDSFHPGSITDTSDSQFILMPMRLSTE